MVRPLKPPDGSTENPPLYLAQAGTPDTPPDGKTVPLDSYSKTPPRKKEATPAIKTGIHRETVKENERSTKPSQEEKRRTDSFGVANVAIYQATIKGEFYLIDNIITLHSYLKENPAVTKRDDITRTYDQINSLAKSKYEYETEAKTKDHEVSKAGFKSFLAGAGAAGSWNAKIITSSASPLVDILIDHLFKEPPLPEGVTTFHRSMLSRKEITIGQLTEAIGDFKAWGGDRQRALDQNILGRLDNIHSNDSIETTLNKHPAFSSDYATRQGIRRLTEGLSEFKEDLGTMQQDLTRLAYQEQLSKGLLINISDRLQNEAEIRMKADESRRTLIEELAAKAPDAITAQEIRQLAESDPLKAIQIGVENLDEAEKEKTFDKLRESHPLESLLLEEKVERKLSAEKQKILEQAKKEYAKEEWRDKTIVDLSKTSLSVFNLIIGKRNPDLARKVSAIGGAAINIYEVTRAFQRQADTGALASAALTMNYVEIALVLFSALSKQGPSFETLALEGIANIREDLQGVHRSLKGHLIAIDEKLDFMFGSMINTLSSIESISKQNRRDTGAVLREIQRLEDELLELQSLLSIYAAEAKLEDYHSKREACLRPSATQISYDTFNGCANSFGNVAKTFSKSAAMVIRTSDDPTAATSSNRSKGFSIGFEATANTPSLIDIMELMYDESSSSYFSYSKRLTQLTSIARILSDKEPYNTQLANPLIWHLGIDTLLELHKRWPDLRGQFFRKNKRDIYFQELYQPGVELNEAALDITTPPNSEWFNEMGSCETSIFQECGNDEVCLDEPPIICNGVCIDENEIVPRFNLGEISKYEIDPVLRNTGNIRMFRELSQIYAMSMDRYRDALLQAMPEFVTSDQSGALIKEARADVQLDLFSNTKGQLKINPLENMYVPNRLVSELPTSSMVWALNSPPETTIFNENPKHYLLLPKAAQVFRAQVPQEFILAESMGLGTITFELQYRGFMPLIEMPATKMAIDKAAQRKVKMELAECEEERDWCKETPSPADRDIRSKPRYITGTMIPPKCKSDGDDCKKEIQLPLRVPAPNKTPEAVCNFIYEECKKSALDDIRRLFTESVASKLGKHGSPIVGLVAFFNPKPPEEGQTQQPIAIWHRAYYRPSEKVGGLINELVSCGTDDTSSCDKIQVPDKIWDDTASSNQYYAFPGNLPDDYNNFHDSLDNYLNSGRTSISSLFAHNPDGDTIKEEMDEQGRRKAIEQVTSIIDKKLLSLRIKFFGEYVGKMTSEEGSPTLDNHRAPTGNLDYLKDKMLDLNRSKRLLGDMLTFALPGDLDSWRGTVLRSLVFGSKGLPDTRALKELSRKALQEPVNPMDLELLTGLLTPHTQDTRALRENRTRADANDFAENTLWLIDDALQNLFRDPNWKQSTSSLIDDDIGALEDWERKDIPTPIKSRKREVPIKTTRGCPDLTQQQTAE